MKNELVFKDMINMEQVVESLLEEEYVVMISREEDYYVVNFLYAPDSNRDYVVFRTCEEQDELDDELYDNIIADLRKDKNLK